MKSLLKILVLFTLLLVNHKTLAVTHESCTTGLYSSYYSTLSSCNVCWYHNFRFYRGNNYWLWDFFNNTQSREYLMSTNNTYSYARIHNIQANVNYTLGSYVWTNTSWLTANWMPNTAWINWNLDTVIFLINNVSWNQNISNRNIPVWIVEYNLRHYEVTPSWTSTANTTYAYLNWTETVAPNWLLNLNTSWVNSSWVKSYNPIPFDHKECYVMLPAWCWDGVIDSNYWEVCEPNDPSRTWWWTLWCSSSCQPLWTTSSSSSSSSSSWGGSSTSSSWGGSSSSWWWSSSWGGSSWWWSLTCWDGILQRPNSSWIMEECDFWSNYSNWPSWCSLPTATPPCEILENTIPWWFTDIDISIPWWWTIVLSPANSVLLWHNMGVFEYLSSNNAYIQNNSTSDVYIDRRLCVYQTWFEYNALSWNNLCSSWEIWLLNSWWWRRNLNVPDNRFVTTTANMPTSVRHVDGQIITTLEWLQNSSSFLRWVLDVRVAKPTVNTIGWWASLLNGTRFSDVNTLSQWWWLLNPELNRNLILTSLWINPLSSYTKTITDSEFINKSKTDWNNDLSWFNENFWSWILSTINTLPTQKFNWLENVFVHVWNINLSSQTINGWNKTFIIENWNLNINWNITSNDNILFVVKNWNINIQNNVTKIDAIIINIWWEIKAEDDSTNNRLVVNWAIYWKVDDLLAKRTYIKDRWEYVDVWTNVNFTSKVFTSPPPLLSKFLGEYMEWNKIPK